MSAPGTPPRVERLGVLVALAGLLLLLGLLARGGGAEAAPAKAANGLGGKILGFSGIRPRGDLDPGTTARLTTGIDGNASRTVMHWQALEPARDVYQKALFRQFDALYRGLRAGGVKPIFVLQYAPAWARDAGVPRLCGASDSCHYPPADSMLGEWREFVRMIARRYRGAAIEIWNEPNYKGQWQSGVNPARYMRVLAAADSAAASVDPKIPVYAGGLGTAVKAHSQSPGTFLRRAYAARPSLRGRTDALNLHIFPERYLGPGSALGNAFAAARSARAAAGDDRTPILVSELGRTTTGPFRISEAEQAEILVHATRKILGMRDSLGVLVYTLADRDELPAGDHERGFGVVRPGPGELSRTARPKAAYCALREEARSPYPGCRFSHSGPRLQLRVKPHRAHARPGGRLKRFKVRVRAPKAERKVKLVKVCVKTRSASVRLGTRECRRLGTLRRGGTLRTKFKVGLRRGAHGKARKLRFRVSGFRAKPDRAGARLAVR